MGITGNISTTTAGLDRFGRVTDQRWVKADGDTIDRYTYAYDRGSNRTTRNNEKKSTYNEDYTYDGLQRLVDVDRNDVAFQSWTLSQTGNWDSFVNQGTTTAKTFNKANEIATIDTSSTQLGFDPAGNMTKMPSAQDSSATNHATYDAWNRMTACKADNSGSPGTTIATYSYDGLRRRVRKVVTVDSVTHDNYYSAAWQLLEVRKNSDTDPLDQYVWCLRYIDAVAIRFHDGNLDGDYNAAADSTYYYTNDANMNVTALIDPGATCRGRFAYDAYGQPLFLKKHWDVRTIQESYRDNPILYAGYHYDEETGLYNVRHRTYHPKQARWMQQDPLGRDITMRQEESRSAMPTNAFTPRDNLAPSAAGYYDGMSLYEYVGSRPIVKIDPRGLSVTCKYTSGSRVDKEKVSVSYYLGGNPSVGEMMWDKIWTGRTKWRTRYKNKYQCMCKYRCQGTKCVIRATPKGRRRTNILGIEYATVVVNTYKYYAEGSSMSQHASHSDYLAAKQNAADVFGKVTADLLEKGLWPKGDDEGDLEATARALVKDGWSKSISKMIVAEAKKKGGIKGKDAFDKIMKAKLAEYKKKCSGWCSAKLGKEKGS